MSLKNVLKKIKLVFVSRLLGRRFDSRAYWQRRYQTQGTSGGGSYGKLAEFKARVLNDFVREKGIETVLEFGCGDGNQLLLADYPRYTGLDVSRKAIRLCREKFPDDPARMFELYDPFAFDPAGHRADLTLSLDVIYHLVEDDVFEQHMRHLFACARRFVIIYSSDIDEPQTDAHVRRRKFSRWIETHAREWSLLARIENPYPLEKFPTCVSRSDFFIYEPDKSKTTD